MNGFKILLIFENVPVPENVKSLKIFNNTLECLSHAKDTLHLLPSFHNLTHLCVYSWSPEKTNGVLMDILQKTPKLEVLTIPGAVLNYLDADMEKMTNVWNQLEDVDVESCVIKFLYSYYSSDDEDDEYEAANSGVLPAAEPL
ncbi:hypothetical protein P8452_10369 [Trifolium repens]|nr:hypothetical protein P8452_10369 [Trifolium repens]